ncbi:MAG: hypothetical protein UW69_C0063G0003 [Microgenomates group bacterium GW2011_GWA2_44_7]|nr:MAG: hypothetical protein UW69_C0063G0003 [Microgenomates group bacterium GW2011_GWA2_44_7]
MTQDELTKIAKDIIKNNVYLTSGTTDGNSPWTTPTDKRVEVFMK